MWSPHRTKLTYEETYIRHINHLKAPKKCFHNLLKVICSFKFQSALEKFTMKLFGIDANLTLKNIIHILVLTKFKH